MDNMNMKYQKPEMKEAESSMRHEILAHSWNPGHGNDPDKPWDPHGPKPHKTKERDEWEIFGE